MSKVSTKTVAMMLVVVTASLLVPSDAFVFRRRPTVEANVIEVDSSLAIENDVVVPVVEVSPRRYNQNCFFTPMNCAVARHQRGFFPLGAALKRLRRIAI